MTPNPSDAERFYQDSPVKMNLDFNNNDYADRFEACRKADAEKEALVTEILQRYEDLKLAHVRLIGEFENEQECRRLWKGKFDNSERALVASKQEFEIAKRTADSQSFVVVILDGDGAIFEDDYYKRGKEGGGLAAANLEKQIRSQLQLAYPDQSTSSWSIITYVFLNVDGLAGALHDRGLPQNDLRGGLAAFGQSFSRANPLFNFIDVGYGKERADHKVRETLRAFLPLSQCKHVFFGPCHDTGYIPVLEPYALNSDTKSRFTLISTCPPERGFRELGLDIITMDGLFRNTNLPTRPSLVHRPTTNQMREEVAPDEPPASLRSTSNGEGVPVSPSLTVAAPSMTGAAASSWSAVAGTIIGDNNVIDISSPEIESAYILLSINDERLDPPLPHYGRLTVAQFEDKRRKAGKNFCNDYHLNGACHMQSRGCSHAHGQRLPKQEQYILRDKARGIICYEGSDCRDFECHRGHQCKFGSGCSDSDCRMACFHGINTIPYKKVFYNGRIETLANGRV